MIKLFPQDIHNKTNSSILVILYHLTLMELIGRYEAAAH